MKAFKICRKRQKKLNEYQDNCTKLQKENSQLKHEVDNLAVDLQESRGNNARLKSTLLELQRKLEDMKKQRNSFQDKCQELEDRHGKRRIPLAQNLKYLKEQQSQTWQTSIAREKQCCPNLNKEN